MNAYVVRFVTDYVVLITTATADTEEQAERYALQTLQEELGVTLEKYDLDIQLEGEWN